MNFESQTAQGLYWEYCRASDYELNIAPEPGAVVTEEMMIAYLKFVYIMYNSISITS